MSENVAEIIAISAPEASSRAIDTLVSGGVIAFPTETVYGLGTCCSNHTGEKKLRHIKGRNQNKPFQVLISDIEDIKALGAVFTDTAQKLVKKFWPGALTIVLPLKEGGTIGLRMPNDAFVRDIIRKTGCPLLATSANTEGGIPAKNTEEIARIFGGVLDLIIDGEPGLKNTASTVIEVKPNDWEILREGAISKDEIDKALHQ